jgi:hypothetical protein
MNQPQEKSKDPKVQIAAHIARLSRLLGMIPSDGAIRFCEPLTENDMMLSDWLSLTRNSFLTLSLLISRELDLELQ